MTVVMDFDRALFSARSKITGIIFALFVAPAISALSALGSCHEMGPKENRSPLSLSRSRAFFLSPSRAPRFIVCFGY